MPSGASTLTFSLAFVLSVTSSARAGVPSRARGGLTEDDKPFSVFAGLAVGSDSNVRRASTDEESDVVVQLLAGAAFTGGNERSKVDLRAQYRLDMYAALSELNFDETRVALSARTGTDRFRFSVVLAHDVLVDPTDAEVVDLLERTRTSYAPVVNFEFGAMGFGLGYSANILDYEDPLYDRLDFGEEIWSGEARWTLKQTRQFFARFEACDLDYASVHDRNFERLRACLGLRAESPRELGFEVGLGTDAIEKHGVAGELYALLRGTAVFAGGRSVVDLVVSHGTEAAADADFKRATRLVARYTHKPNRRLAWSVTLSGQNDDLYHSTYLSDPLTLVILEAGVSLELGSPGKVHGRCYLTLGNESRTAEAAADEYNRFRLLVGVGLVY